jgi:WS/DGAT/MGAT family acyltransferase
MSNTEAIMWAVEKDPALRSDFCNLTLLDALPTEDRLHEAVQRALGAMPRLRQRVISAPLRIVPPEFADDPSLDLDYHVRRVAVPAPGDFRAVLDVCQQMAEAPFDRSRPLWEFTLLEGIDGDRAALLQKLHHTISDGVGALRLSLALLDFEPDPEPPPPASGDAPSAGDGANEEAPPRSTTPIDVLVDALSDATARNVEIFRRVISETGHVLTRPVELPGRAMDVARVARSLQRQGLVADPSQSDVLVERSLKRRFEVHALPLPDVKRRAKELGGSINDVYVTGLCAALGRYHAREGSDVAQLRMAMPINTRTSGDRSSNRFAPARVVVPIQPAADPAELFPAVQARLTSTKGEAALHVLDSVSGLASALPTALLVAYTRSQVRTIDFAATNLRGSAVPLFLAGSRILANYPFGPRTGSALNCTMLGYCDELHIGCNLDPAAVADPDALRRDIASAFDDLLSG